MVTTNGDWTAELDRRRTRLREAMEANGCEMAIVFGSQGHSENFRYVANFVPVLGDMWALFRRGGEITCVLNFTWQLEEARRFSRVPDWHGQFDAAPVIADLVASERAARVGIVGMERIPAVAYGALRERVADTEFVDLTPEVAALRRTKSQLEIDLLREAARVTDLALDVVYEEAEVGMTEQELAARIGFELHRNGAEWAFPPSVISGIDDPIPIRASTRRELAEGDSVMVDLGAAVSGYCADASRTIVMGEPSRDQERVWGVITEAYDAAVGAVRPGVPCRDVHRAAADVIERAGFEVAHRIGHGIGLATSFEWPSLDSEPAPLEPGMTICIEPGIYVRGAGNMKLEDDVLVTDEGHDVLTRAQRGLRSGR
jgi:Xaa-Pro aminopeptidase